MKKIFLFFFSFLVSLLFFVPTTFAQSKSIVMDKANLFSNEEITQLENLMAPIEEETKATLMIASSYDLSQDDPRYNVDRTLGDYVGNDENGVLLFFDMTGRQVYISTSGNMIHYFTDSRIDSSLDAIFAAGLSEGNYYAASETFIKEVENNFKAGIPSGHYTIDEETGKVTMYKSITPFEAFIAFLVAFIAAVAVFLIIKGKYQLKKVDYHYDVGSFSKIELTEKSDTLINSFVTTRRIPRNNGGSGGGLGGGGSTTHSSGGGTFGGGSRGF